MASLTWWMWVWARSGSWWWSRKPGVLQSMGLQSRIWLSNWTDSLIRLNTYNVQIIRKYLVMIVALHTLVSGILYIVFMTFDVGHQNGVEILVLIWRQKKSFVGNNKREKLVNNNPQTYFSVSTNKEISLIILVVLTHWIPLTWIFQGKSSSFIMWMKTLCPCMWMWRMCPSE